MTTPTTNATDRARSLRAEHGADWDAVLGGLRAEGFSLVDSAVATRNVLGVDLGVAKRIVHYSPVWADTGAAAEELHDALRSTLT